MFIAFEGVDGAGKSTQVRLLGEHLERGGREVVICREPGGTGLGEELRRILLDPGSGDLQDRDVEGEPLYGRVADGLGALERALAGRETSWSSLGVVCGATWPEQARRVRAALPRALFLVPGYGAQGGSAAAAVEGFADGPSGLEGGLVNSSRGIVFPADARSADAIKPWEHAVDAALESAIAELSDAVRR